MADNIELKTVSNLQYIATDYTSITENCIDRKLEELNNRIDKIEQSSIQNKEEKTIKDFQRREPYIVCQIIGNIGQTTTKYKFLDLNKHSDQKFYKDMKRFILVVNTFSSIYQAYNYYININNGRY
jgi:hypothetical protein